MGIVARHLLEIRASETKAMTARAAALRAQGRSVITLSQGEPDFDTPAHVRDASCRAIVEGKTRYTEVAGLEALRDAIGVKLARDHNLRYSQNEITVGCGAKQVVYNALMATLDPGDEVIIPAPCWVSYTEMVRMSRGVPVVTPTADSGFKLTAATLEGAITPRTKWLVLNSPCNPTGVVYSADDLAELASVLRDYPQVWVLSDDIYEKLVYPGNIFATMAAVAPDLRDRTLTVNGLSKSHAMTGWRVGYGAGPRELIRMMNLIQSQSTSHTSSISQYAAIAALLGDDSFLDRFRLQYEQRRDIVVGRINAVSGLTTSRPAGAFYVYVGCGDLIGARTPNGSVLATDTDIATYLLDAGVAVVPGSAFLTSPFIRLSYATATDDVIQGCDRITDACGQLERRGS